MRGKFLHVGHEKFYVRGATYGPFGPTLNGDAYGARDLVERDLARMAAGGLNAVRTYAVPPRWFLDTAQRLDLRVMVGLPWEQHVTFLDDPKRARTIEARMRADVRACDRHPAILCYAIGNEIPASIVRWHGRRAVERYIRRLFVAAKTEDPDALFTYVNYPTTEYLDLPFLDLICFNVFLESRQRLEAYLPRLHNIADGKPLLITEIGLDSRRHGERAQAEALAWQVRTTFETGCAGAFVFAWTDEWHRGGYAIEDWDFGLTDRQRRPKAALATVRDAFGEVPFPQQRAWPRISVVVCTYNGAHAIGGCLDGLAKLQYPNVEVIVVNDGSVDDTAAIAQRYGVRLINSERRGLSSARNTGLEAATGEIVAYIDDDAWPDPHWLTYLANTFMTTEYAGVGGPNLAPDDDGFVARCVAKAAGGPIHVLLSDQEAEHIPGCNMAFRKTALQAIGGFDPQFWIAGDDVDVCWRVRDAGGKLGFSPGAVVWHRRRGSVRAFWRQQVNYGKAEALLEGKYPEKYNAGGHLTWAGRIYDDTHGLLAGWRRGRIYQGTWGSAPFQSVHEPAFRQLLWSLIMMPEWYLIVAAAAALSILGTMWTPLLAALPVMAVALMAPVFRAMSGAVRSFDSGPARPPVERLASYGLTAFFNLIQPLARLWGHLRGGLTPWRRGRARHAAPPFPRTFTIWSDTWRAPAEWLESLEAALRQDRLAVVRGGSYDRWDLDVHGGAFGLARLLMAVEEHGAGRQMLKFVVWPKSRATGIWGTMLTAGLATGAAVDGASTPAAILGAAAAALLLRTLRDCAAAMGTCRRALTAAVESPQTALFSRPGLLRGERVDLLDAGGS